jgi:hypothetical protein
MKDFFIMIGLRIKKLIATLLSIPFLLLLLLIYVNADTTIISIFAFVLLTKRQIDKIKRLGYFGKDK